MCNGIDIQMYANDTVLYTYAKATEPAAGKLTIAMERITIDQSCLSLNVRKTKWMFFSQTKDWEDWNSKLV